MGEGGSRAVAVAVPEAVSLHGALLLDIPWSLLTMSEETSLLTLWLSPES